MYSFFDYFVICFRGEIKQISHIAQHNDLNYGLIVVDLSITIFADFLGFSGAFHLAGNRWSFAFMRSMSAPNCLKAGLQKGQRSTSGQMKFIMFLLLELSVLGKVGVTISNGIKLTHSTAKQVYT